jgi:hypothetical protein
VEDKKEGPIENPDPPVYIFTDGETWVFARTKEEAYNLEKEAVREDADFDKWEQVPPEKAVTAGMSECGLFPRNLPKILPNENFDFVPLNADIRAVARAKDWVNRHLEMGGTVPSHFLSVYV